MTFPGTFARERPDHPAVVMAGSGDTLTYRELDERSNQLAQLWHDRGLRRGDHVGDCGARAGVTSVDLADRDTGKLSKRLLKDRYWGHRTSRIV